MDWKYISEQIEILKGDAVKLSLDEFIEQHGFHFWHMWDKYNLDCDHDEQIFKESDD